MAHILLISDTERVKRVFESLGKKGSLQLRTVATLIEADQDIAGAAPEFTFVQNRISGFSGEIILRHLKKVLPAGAKLIFLADDPEAMKQAHKHAESCLDLSLGDDDLAGAVQEVLDGGPRPRGAAAGDREAPAPSGHQPKAGHDAKAKHVAKEASEPKAGPEPKAKPEGKAKPEAKPEAKPDVKVNEDHPGAAAAPGPAGAATITEQAPRDAGLAVLGPQESGTGGHLQEAPEAVPPEASGAAEAPADRSQGGSRSAAPAGRGAKTAQLQPPGPAERSEAPSWQSAGKAGGQSFAELMSRASDQMGTVQPVSVGEFTRGEPVADAIRRARKKKRPVWLYPLIVALVCIPVISYLAGKRTAPPESALAPHTMSRPARSPNQPRTAPETAPAPAAASRTASPAAPKVAPATPAAKPWAPPAASVPPVAGEKPAAKPAIEEAAKPAAKEAVKPAAKPAAEPVRKGGLKTPPPMVTRAKLDEAYGKTHPGWQRYLGATLEYKLFKEADLYKALQVLSRTGNPIPDQLFKKALVEFGGTERYQVKSAGDKGKYLVEQGVTKGDVAVTIYRNKSDRLMKAFVLYYR